MNIYHPHYNFFNHMHKLQKLNTALHLLFIHYHCIIYHVISHGCNYHWYYVSPNIMAKAFDKSFNTVEKLDKPNRRACICPEFQQCYNLFMSWKLHSGKRKKLLLHSKHCTQSLKSITADNNLLCFARTYFA